MSKFVPKRLAHAVEQVLRQGCRTSFTLFRIIVPVMVLTKILQELRGVDLLGRALGPVMHAVGLPGSMGLVWASAMLTNLYGGMAVFAQLAPAEHLTAAQATVLTTMMLVAHALPVELRIAQKAGTRFRFMVVLRLGGALALGFLLHQFYTRTGMLQHANVAIWTAPAAPPTLWAWAIQQLRTLVMMFLIILTLLSLLAVLKAAGITELLTRMLAPLLRLLGMSRTAAPLTIIGMTLGLAYGGGLIIEEARAGHLAPRDVFFSLSLLGLCHSLIEDTLLMISLGGHVSGVLLGRAAFSIVVVFLLVRLLSRLGEDTFNRLLFRPAKPR